MADSQKKETKIYLHLKQKKHPSKKCEMMEKKMSSNFGIPVIPTTE